LGALGVLGVPPMPPPVLEPEPMPPPVVPPVEPPVLELEPTPLDELPVLEPVLLEVLPAPLVLLSSSLRQRSFSGPVKVSQRLAEPPMALGDEVLPLAPTPAPDLVSVLPPRLPPVVAPVLLLPVPLAPVLPLVPPVCAIVAADMANNAAAVAVTNNFNVI
jgi:hypothetical protein